MSDSNLAVDIWVYRDSRCLSIIWQKMFDTDLTVDVWLKVSQVVRVLEWLLVQLLADQGELVLEVVDHALQVLILVCVIVRGLWQAGQTDE